MLSISRFYFCLVIDAPVAMPMGVEVEDAGIKNVFEPAVEIRNYFPETWLWDLVEVG